MSALGQHIAELIAKEEGFYVDGSIPQRQHNPGDLRHAPGESHPEGSPNSVGSFPDDAAGWAALERQLGLYAERGLTLRQCIEIYAPDVENDTQRYLDFVCTGLNCGPDILVADALKIE